MKFIVDAQLPKSLSNFLKWKGFDSIHTIDLPDKNETKDNSILKLSLSENRVVITKDIDFFDSFLIKSQPKKLVLVKTGNISNKALLDLFSSKMDLIVKMLKRSSLIEISKTDIAERN